MPGYLVVLVESASSSAHTKLRFWGKKHLPSLETNSLQAPENGCLEYVSFSFPFGVFVGLFSGVVLAVGFREW